VLCRLGRCQHFSKTYSNFRAEVAMLGRGGIYVGLEEGNSDGEGQSGMRNEAQKLLDQ
jgi:hypothetical protein